MATNVMSEDAARRQAETRRLTRGERLSEPAVPPPNPPAPEPSAESRRTDAEMAERIERGRTGGAA
jgi:hypothetical protein